MSVFTQAQKFGYQTALKNNPGKLIPIAIPNDSLSLDYVRNADMEIKRLTTNWVFVSATLESIDLAIRERKITDFYFEYCPPALMDDTARAMHRVNEVHNGISPLHQSYTGNDVIIGIVDEGLDHRHPDFIKPNGDSRVIRYWDHSVSSPTQTPAPYNYGQIWYAHQINDGTITSNEETSGHGTTVTGIAAGNGLANGTNKGMAPESDIIFVETNFSLPNWTLTIADACDYIFRVADSLGKPAVVNLSLGTYLGSHDGSDPASEFMESLLEQKGGRIIVCAAGNSGAQAPYHAQAIMNPLDTNFVWFENNPNGSLGNNTIYFDLWTNQSNAQFEYAFGANLPGPSYESRASTVYRGATDNVGPTLFDTLWSPNGDRIATLEIYTEYVGSNFHMQGFCSQMDSTAYRLQFSTTGSGKYDLWSGTFLGLNEIVESVPSPLDYPPIINYIKPDTLQSIVSSWNCSDKVISVGNLRGRLGHIDNNGNQYYPATDMTTPGNRAPSSSRGPARTGLLKPDIMASGDVTLGSGPFWILNDASYNALIDSGGWHVRNGGTSMASPVVAGIAALYLEKCPNSSWGNFKSDMMSSATEDLFTGLVPNFEFGAGKIDAFNLLLETEGNLRILGDTVICQMPVELNTNIPLINYEWSTGDNTSSVMIGQADTVYLSGQNVQRCLLYSDTLILTEGSPLPNPSITQIGNSLVSSNAPNYQWFLNDNPIPGDTNQVIYPDSIGFYSVAITDGQGCRSFSNAFQWSTSLYEYDQSLLKIYPNPVHDLLYVNAGGEIIQEIAVISLSGREIKVLTPYDAQTLIDLSDISAGSYLLRVSISDQQILRKISVQ